METQLELSIEDGVCVARRTIPGVSKKKVPSGTIMDALGAMTEEERIAVTTRFPNLSDLTDAVSYRQKILGNHPNAEYIQYCKRTCGWVGGLCKHPKWHVFNKLVEFEGGAKCSRCEGWFEPPRPFTGASRLLGAPSHIHTTVRMGTGPRDAVFYIYGATAYIAAKDGDIPAEVLTILKESAALKHYIASPEMLTDAGIVNEYRIRDPLLFAGWNDKEGYLIYQWE